MHYKIVLVGDVAVGKTSLINRFVKGFFTESYKATIGVDIFTKEISINGQEVNLQVWDIAGQTSFQQFRQRFFSGARGALLVFDLTIPQSLTSLHSSWIQDIGNTAGKIPLVLIGNKLDLTDLLIVKPNAVYSLLEQHPNITSYFRTSAVTGENVEKAFHELASIIISIS
ncbi:MAG: Rab family GTPase [Candidatus Hodarchaeota archaeon]